MRKYEVTIDADKFSRFDSYNMYARVNNELKTDSHYPIIFLEDVRKFYALDSIHLDEIFEVKDEWLKDKIREEGTVVGYIDKATIKSNGDCCYSCCILDKNDITTDIGSNFKRMREAILKEAQSNIPDGCKGSMLAGVINMIKQGYAPNYYFAYDGSYPIKVYIPTRTSLNIGDEVTLKFSKEERGIVAIYKGQVVGSLYPVPAQRVIFMLDETTMSFKGKVCDIYKTGVNVLSDILSPAQIAQAKKDMKEYQESKK